MGKKKEKKRLKAKKGEKHKNYSSSESSSCEEWIESSTTDSPVSKNVEDSKRDEWMSVSDFVPTFSNNELKSKKDKASKNDQCQLNTLDKPGQHQRELNPYWKDGGHGLPTTQVESKASSGRSVGDGGLDWLRRAYKRVIDQAKEQGRTAEEVAAERWGSLDKLRAMLKEAEQNAESGESSKYRRESHSGSSYRSRYEDRKDYQRTFQKPSEYAHEGRRHHQQMFKKPSEDAHEKRRDRQQIFKKPSEDEHDSVYSRYIISKSSSDKPRWQRPSNNVKSDKSSYEPVTKSPSSCENNILSRKTENIHSQVDVRSFKQDENTKTSKDSEESSKKQTKAEIAKDTLTKKEMNELGAKIIKAELLGNTELAAKLKARLNAVTEVSAEVKTSTAQEVVVLTQTNSRGLVSPLTCSSVPGTSQAPAGQKRKMKNIETHRDGQRMCYFQDDSKYTLQQMFEKEKFSTADDETAMYLKMAGGKSRIKTDDDFMIDDALLNKQTRYEPEEKQAERQKNRAIKEHKFMNSLMERCRFCLDSKHMEKHLIVTIGNKVYLSLPSCESLEEGHCYIVPMTHVPATTHLDEDVWEEVKLFRRKLCQMFKSQDKDVVFMETSLHLRRHPHALIECVPLSVELGTMAPMYFKKAILECDTEWAQNKKLVDLSKKDVRHSVPKGLPYFAVDFGMDGGFAHVVEDEQLFPDYFGQEILGGMLDLEPRKWHKPLKQNFKDQSQKVLEFEKWWKPFDVASDTNAGRQTI